MQTTETFDVWTWRAGQPWRRVLEGAPLNDTTRALVTLDPGSSGAAFSACLAFNPNRATVDELADLAEIVAGPIPDVIGRRHH